MTNKSKPTCKKLAISLSEELKEHAEKRAAEIAEQTHTPKNVSAFVARLIVQDIANTERAA